MGITGDTLTDYAPSEQTHSLGTEQHDTDSEEISALEAL
jgi:hypothetical protein